MENYRAFSRRSGNFIREYGAHQEAVTASFWMSRCSNRAARFHLGPELPPGEYVLQITVDDNLAKEKQRTATQWIDFEVVK